MHPLSAPRALMATFPLNRGELEELGWHVLQVTSTQMKREEAVLASVISNSLQHQ